MAEITEVGTKEVLPDTPQSEPQPQPQPDPQPLPNPERPHVSEGPVATATPQASLEVKAVRQEGTDAVGKEVEKTAQHQQFQLLQFPKVDYQIRERKKVSQASLLES